MKYFILDNKKKVPVNFKKYLLPMLTSTAKGTNYWDTPPKGPMTKAYMGDKILQIHQFLSLTKELNIDLKDKTILDVGAGNGLISKLILEFSPIKKIVAADPYERNTHISSWQPEKDEKNFLEIYNLFRKVAKKKLSFKNYKKILKETAAANTFIPQDIIIKKNLKKNKKFVFYKVDAHSLKKTKAKYDLIYCKAIEHIPEWRKMIKSFSDVSKKNTIVYFKHRSFFSYLGPHRFSSTGIPWGHVILNDKEFKNYVKKFHYDREKAFLENYYNGLAWPRYSVSDLIKMAQEKGFSLFSIQLEAPSYIKQITKFPNDIQGFWNLVKKNYPSVSSDELFSGTYHIFLKKN